LPTHRLAGGWTFDDTSGELRRYGTVTRLEPQPAAVLALLAAQAGQVVTHDEIRRVVWGDKTHVNFQDSVHYCVRQIRVALGDHAQQPSFVETIPRRGYRFKTEAVQPRGPGLTPRWIAIAAFALTSVIAIFVIEQQPNNHHEVAVAILKAAHDLVF
jgi:DNA-binding winged helix-turn-helix (wHTH) protein